MDMSGFSDEVTKFKGCEAVYELVNALRIDSPKRWRQWQRGDDDLDELPFSPKTTISCILRDDIEAMGDSVDQSKANLYLHLLGWPYAAIDKFIVERKLGKPSKRIRKLKSQWRKNYDKLVVDELFKDMIFRDVADTMFEYGFYAEVFYSVEWHGYLVGRMVKYEDVEYYPAGHLPFEVSERILQGYRESSRIMDEENRKMPGYVEPKPKSSRKSSIASLLRNRGINTGDSQWN